MKTVTDFARYREKIKREDPDSTGLNINIDCIPVGLSGMRRFVPESARNHVETAWFDWPALENASLKLFEYLTPYYPDSDGGRLFSNIIAKAAQLYTERSALDGEASAEAMHLFMRTLTEVFDTMLSYSAYIVMADGTTKLWHPVRLPLLSFINENRATGLSFNLTSKYQFLRQVGRELLIAQILSPGEALMLRESEGKKK